MARILGIDEAGRGCVLGPLTVGAYLAENVSDERLIAAGAADSKALSIKKRLLAREALTELGVPHLHLISAVEIDRGNLNTLEEHAIVTLVLSTRPDTVIIDALGHPSTLPATLERLKHAVGPTGHHIQWLIEPKADRTYPIVGAASIFAKTERDGVIESLKAQYGDFGSGYPSDPKTKRWLSDWNASKQDWPPFVRTRWGTVRNLSQQSLLA